VGVRAKASHRRSTPWLPEQRAARDEAEPDGGRAVQPGHRSPADQRERAEPGRRTQREQHPEQSEPRASPARRRGVARPADQQHQPSSASPIATRLAALGRRRSNTASAASTSTGAEPMVATVANASEVIATEAK